LILSVIGGVCLGYLFQNIPQGPKYIEVTNPDNPDIRIIAMRDNSGAMKIASDDIHAQDLIKNGGNISGVVTDCASGLRDLTGYTCLPAVRIDTKENQTYFIVDPKREKVVMVEYQKNWDS
jgi:hypothetical protein